MAKKLNPMAVRRALTYDTEELARALGVTPPTIRNMVRRGMPVMASQKPHLFSGEAVREFIRAERVSNRKPMTSDQLFCPSCGRGRKPMAMLAELTRPTPKTMQLKGLCEVCEGGCNRMISPKHLPQFMATFDITQRAGAGA